MGRIVVGIDGSEQSREALRWAVSEADLRGATVEAVYAYEYTPSWRTYAYGDEQALLTEEQARTARDSEERAHEQATEHARTLVERMVEEVGHDPSVSVSSVAVEDRRPARALVERSKGADLLVVGSRGRGGFTGLLLGSVSQQCAQHASCPVVIIALRS